MEVFEWLTVNCIGLCITPGIQKRGTEWGDCISENVSKHSGEYPQTCRV